jgi:hypothetical protein
MRKLLAATLLLCACTPDFDSQSRVHDLRVLAIQTDPPEAVADLPNKRVDPVQITALVVNPGSTSPLWVRGRVCFPTDNGRCDTPETVVLDRRTAPFTGKDCIASPHPPPDVPWDCVQADPTLIGRALQDDRLKGFGGIRVQVSLEVDAGGPSIWAQKLLVYTVTGTVPNHNPRIASVELTRDGQALRTFHPDQPEQQCLPVGVEIGLLPKLGTNPGEGAETYTTVDLSGKQVTLTESPRYAFFATDPGDLDRDVGDEPLPGNVPPRGLVRLTALAAGAGTAWIVVRDGRGGEGWIDIPFRGASSCP